MFVVVVITVLVVVVVVVVIVVVVVVVVVVVPVCVFLRCWGFSIFSMVSPLLFNIGFICLTLSHCLVLLLILVVFCLLALPSFGSVPVSVQVFHR